mgnify:CR=1 FL=1
MTEDKKEVIKNQSETEVSKKVEDVKKSDGTKTKSIRGIPKLVDANKAGTNESFPSSANDSDYLIIIDDIGSATSGATGDVLTTIGNNHAGNPIFTQPSGNGTSVFDFGSNYANAKIKILATVNRSTAGSKSKTLNTGSIKDVTTLPDKSKILIITLEFVGCVYV